MAEENVAVGNGVGEDEYDSAAEADENLGYIEAATEDHTEMEENEEHDEDSLLKTDECGDEDAEEPEGDGDADEPDVDEEADESDGDVDIGEPGCTVNGPEEDELMQSADAKENIDVDGMTTTPPDPCTVPVVRPFTAEDTLKLGTFSQKEDDVSLIVHVDDTMNDLDNDLNGEHAAVKAKSLSASAAPTATLSAGKVAQAAKPTGSKVSTAPSKSAATTVASSGLNLWISGLSTKTKAADLKLLFSKHGRVSAAKVVTKAKTPGARCFGLVTMSSKSEVDAGIKHLHGTELHGKMIAVERAKREPPTSASKVIIKATNKASPRGKPAVTAIAGTKGTPAAKPAAIKKPTPAKKANTIKKVEPVTKGAQTKNNVKNAGTGVKKAEVAKVAKPNVKRDEKKKADTPRSGTKSVKNDAKDKDVLSFQKIKDERERERLRQKERQLRDLERRRMQEIEREKAQQRQVARRQLEQEERLQRERQQLQFEKERIHREAEEMAQRLEADRRKADQERRETERRDEARRREERDKLRADREREERRLADQRAALKRQEEQQAQERRHAEQRAAVKRQEEQQQQERRAAKRPYEDTGHDNHWDAKRPAPNSRYEQRVNHDVDGRRPAEAVSRSVTYEGGRGDGYRYEKREVYAAPEAPPHYDNRRIEPERAPPVRGAPVRYEDRRQNQPPEQRQYPDRHQAGHAGERSSGHSGRGNPPNRAAPPPRREDAARNRQYDQGNRGGQAPAPAARQYQPQAAPPMSRPGPQQSPQHVMHPNPLMQAAPASSQSFLASAANIMMGVGLAGMRQQEQRFDAYKNLSGGVRRF